MILLHTHSRSSLLVSRWTCFRDTPVVAFVPSTRYTSEIQFHHRDRDLFGWMRVDAPGSFRHGGRRWRSIAHCLEISFGGIPPPSEEALIAMRDILEARLKAHSCFRCWLFSTQRTRLLNDNTRDPHWGCGFRGTGGNLLGKLYMQIRDEWKPTAFRKRLAPVPSGESTR